MAAFLQFQTVSDLFQTSLGCPQISIQIILMVFFLARCCLGQVPGGAPFSQRSELATACTNRMQIRN